MKKWLINNFLPMWAKETVLAENRTPDTLLMALHTCRQKRKIWSSPACLTF